MIEKQIDELNQRIARNVEWVAREVALLNVILLNLGKFDGAVRTADDGTIGVFWDGQLQLEIPPGTPEQDQINLITIALKLSC